MCCTSRRGPSRANFIARSRDYDDEEWQQHEQQLAARGLLADDGTLTPAGRELKDHIESSTDALSVSVLDVLSDDEVEALFQVLTPITRIVVEAGDVPAKTPMALRRNELDDDSAHLRLALPGQRLVKDDPVAVVVVDHGAALVGVVVGAPHDAAAAVLDGLGRGVDVSVLMPTTTCPGMGWSTAVASASVTGPPSSAAKWAPSRNFSEMPRVSV